MPAKKKNDPLIGCTVTSIRLMTPHELRDAGWNPPRWGNGPAVLVLSNGTKLYASRDEEGNGPGALFGRTESGQAFTLTGLPS